MFIVGWEGGAPPDKAEWIAVLRDTLAHELGSYRVVFRPGENGWRFELDWREPEPAGEDPDALVANSPESVAFNIYTGLVEAGKPVDAARPIDVASPADVASPVDVASPGDAREPATGASASRDAPRSRRASGRRRRRGR